MTEEILHKLRSAFLMGCTDEEACAYADISPRALYYYQEQHPEYLQEKEKLKQNPFLKARATIYKDLDNRETAKWFLERKKKDEFAPRQEHTGEGGKPIQILFHPVLKQTNHGTGDSDPALPTPRQPNTDTPEDTGD